MIFYLVNVGRHNESSMSKQNISLQQSLYTAPFSLFMSYYNYYLLTTTQLFFLSKKQSI